MLRRLKNVVDRFRRRTDDSGISGRLVGLAVLCGIGAFVPLPGLDGHALSNFFRLDGGSGLLGIYNWLVGGAVARGAVLAIGVMPLFSAKIYLYFARRFSARFAAITRGEAGQVRLTKWTRGLTFGLAVVQSYGFSKFVQSLPGVVANPGPQFVLQSVLLLTAGTMGITWLSERSREENAFAGSEQTIADASPQPIDASPTDASPTDASPTDESPTDASLVQSAEAKQLSAGNALNPDFVKSRESVVVEPG